MPAGPPRQADARPTAGSWVGRRERTSRPANLVGGWPQNADPNGLVPTRNGGTSGQLAPLSMETRCPFGLAQEIVVLCRPSPKMRWRSDCPRLDFPPAAFLT